MISSLYLYILFQKVLDGRSILLQLLYKQWENEFIYNIQDRKVFNHALNIY